jgi:uncharacterized protein
MEESNAFEFLTHRRLALVGVSRDPRDFSRAVFIELRLRGYDVVPVNAAGGVAMDGTPFVRRVQDIEPPVEAALLMTAPVVTTEVVKDCAEAGIRRVWMHRGVGKGAASAAAIAFCREHGIRVVTNACRFMYLPETAFVHRAHRWCRQVLSRPRATSARTPPPS